MTPWDDKRRQWNRLLLLLVVGLALWWFAVKPHTEGGPRLVHAVVGLLCLLVALSQLFGPPGPPSWR